MISVYQFESTTVSNRKIAFTEDGAKTSNIEHRIDGEHTRHPASDQVDPQHRADYEGDANGRRLQDAQGAAARAGWPALRRVDEQGSGLAPKTHRPETASASSRPAAQERARPDHQHRQRTGWRVKHEP